MQDGTPTHPARARLVLDCRKETLMNQTKAAEFIDSRVDR
jgi:hypothetical protein